jgi:hypothetical protein
MRKKRTSRTDGIIDRLLEGLEAGRTLTSICKDDGMPTISAVQKWQREDDELEDKVLRSWISGLRVRHDQNADKQAAILAHPEKHDPKTINAMATIMRDLNHNILAMLTRLDKRFSDKQQIENVGGPYIVGWQWEGDQPSHTD